MSKVILLTIGVTAALVVYFILTVYILPQSYQTYFIPRKPVPEVLDVNMPARVTLGQPFTITVTGINNGEEADIQTISIGFPNLTSASNVKVLSHNFRQTPLLIKIGEKVGAGYAGTAETVNAQYPMVEAMSRPWVHGNLYSIRLQITPEDRGQFTVFVKSVAFPSWEHAHWPLDGLIDPQKEFVKSYQIEVTTNTLNY